MPIVYKHTNRNNGKAYIGWTTLSMEDRWNAHLQNAKTGTTMFYNAIRKHGPDAWDHELLEVHEGVDEAKLAEIRLISKHNTYAYEFLDRGYNMTRGGDGVAGAAVIASNKNRVTKDKTRSKMGITARKKTTSAKTKKLISSVMTGRIFTKQHRLNHKLAQERRVIRVKNNKLISKQVVLLCGGPDRCGKTNILKKIEQTTGIRYFKASSEHENFLNSQDKFINELRYADPRVVDILYQTGLSILVDRAFMCEWVYAQYFDRPTDLHMLRKIDAEYAKLGAKILICTRKSFHGIQDDLNPKLDEKALTKISDLYADFVKWTKCETRTLYVDDEDIEREVKEVMDYIK